MRFRSTFLALALGALAAAFGFVACPSTSGNGSGGAAGQACSAPGSQSNCGLGLACENFLAVPVPNGTQTIAVCQQTCTSNSDCNVTYTKNVCTNGFCTCTPGPVGGDACTAANPNTVCHPDYDYCATVVAPDAGCNPGESTASYDGVTICRPGGGVSGDGGVDGGPFSCGYQDSQGSCSWPQFCSGLGGVACVAPQNVSDAGADAPDPACNYSGGPDGTDNADQLRGKSGTPFAAPIGNNSGGPILMTMSQDQSGLPCDNELGDPDPINSALCLGDNKYCGAHDDVVIFDGYVYDPAAAFDVNEGTQLDGQFYAIVESGSNAGQGQALSDTDPTQATIQIGHIVPSPGNWSTVGGEFSLWRCFLPSDSDAGPTVLTEVGGSFIPAHYAKTTNGPGNSYCSNWALTNN